MSADAAWPDGLPPVQALRYTGGKLSLTPNGWTEPEHAAFAQRAREAGYRAENQADNVLLTRGDGR